MLNQTETILSKLPQSISKFTLRIVHLTSADLCLEMRGINADDYDVFFTYDADDLWGVKKDGTIMDILDIDEITMEELLQWVEMVKEEMGV